MFKVTQAQPDDRLRKFVRGYIQRETTPDFTPPAIEPFVARIGVTLDFLFADPFEIPIRGTDRFDKCMSFAVVGPQTHYRAQLVVRGRLEEVSVLFEPQGFYQLFGIPTHLFVNRAVGGDSALGSEMTRLYERLGDTTDLQSRSQILDAFLLKLLSKMESPGLVSLAFDALLAPARKPTVDDAAWGAGLSLRQFERKSLQYTGISPKTLMRIARFQRALNSRRTTGGRWTNIAHDLDYYDQMHMIHDFRLFAGDSPNRVLSNIADHHLVSLL